MSPTHPLKDRAFQLSQEGKTLTEIARAIGKPLTYTEHLIKEGQRLYQERNKQNSLIHLDIDIRVFNALRRAGIRTIDNLIDAIDDNPRFLFDVPNFGTLSRQQTIKALVDGGHLPAEKAKFYA